MILGSEVDAVTRMGLVREAEGNPLYVEELARAFLEGGLEPRGRTWTVTVRADLLPPALENLLVARIDRLPAGARQLAPTAAAIGRTFPVAVLEEVADGDVGDGPHRAASRRDRARGSPVSRLRVLVHARPPARRRALDADADAEARALRAHRLGVRVAVRRLARRPPRAARPLPRAGREPAEGVRVRRAGARRRSVRLELAREPPVLRVPEG